MGDLFVGERELRFTAVALCRSMKRVPKFGLADALDQIGDERFQCCIGMLQELFEFDNEFLWSEGYLGTAA